MPEIGDNLGTKVFASDCGFDLEFYVQHGKVSEIDIPNLPEDCRQLGEYEAKILGKLLAPVYPVLCIKGSMGSGKSTTMEFLVRQVLRRMTCTGCSANGAPHACKRLIAQIDFGSFSLEASLAELLTVISDELRARAGRLLSHNEEYGRFWDEMITDFDESTDRDSRQVIAKLISERPEMGYQRGPADRDELLARESLRKRLCAQDPAWHLRYLMLVWRYLLRYRFAGHRDCAIIILDNVDSLSPELQRRLVDYVMRNAPLKGPTFVVLVRPETQMRYSLGDHVVDVVGQAPHVPSDIVIDRLRRFCEAPDGYLALVQGFTAEYRDLYKDFLLRMYERVHRDEAFARFIRRASGDSVRVALLLAQGLCALSVGDMRKSDLTTHYLVRACITQGQEQYHAEVRSVITNPFDVAGVDYGTLLLKVRIIDYVFRLDKKCGIAPLRNVFVSLGYDPEEIRLALNDLMRKECQLLRSDGLDLLDPTWGDESQTLFLTKIGEGYAAYPNPLGLIYDVDFIQEVMMDARVPSDGSQIGASVDRLSSKMRAVHHFLRELYREDFGCLKPVVDNAGRFSFQKAFGKRLISLDIVVEVYAAVVRILGAAAAKKPELRPDYQSVLDDFKSLVRIAEQGYAELFHEEPLKSVDDIAI